MLVLINLLAHWWDPAKAAFPRSTTIARRMAVDTRTVQRSTSKLANSGLMTKVVLPDGKRGYDFRKLAARLANDLPAAYGIRREETHRG
jgi:Mn-dependent DtxR family transcriptional regulator